MPSNNLEPPIKLVETWYKLMTGTDDAVSRHARKMIMGCFGSEDAVAKYLIKHNII